MKSNSFSLQFQVRVCHSRKVTVAGVWGHSTHRSREHEAGEMARRLRTSSALAEGSGSVLSTHVVRAGLHNHLYFQFQEFSTLSWPLCALDMHVGHRHIYTQHTHRTENVLSSRPSLHLHSTRQEVLLISRVGSPPPLTNPIKKRSHKLTQFRQFLREMVLSGDGRSCPVGN